MHREVAIPDARKVWFRYQNVEIPGTVDIDETPRHHSDIRDISSTSVLHHWDRYCQSDTIPQEFICAIDHTLLVAPCLDTQGFTTNFPAQIAVFQKQVTHRGSNDEVAIISPFSREVVEIIRGCAPQFQVLRNWHLQDQLVDWVNHRITAHLKRNNIEKVRALHQAIMNEWGLKESTNESTFPVATHAHRYYSKDHYISLYNSMFKPADDTQISRQLILFRNDIGQWAGDYLIQN